MAMLILSNFTDIQLKHIIKRCHEILAKREADRKRREKSK